MSSADRTMPGANDTQRAGTAGVAAARPSVLCAATLLLAGIALLGASATVSAATDEATLRPDDPGDRHDFGDAIAIDGDTAVIGTPRHDQGAEDDNRANRGAVYVFTRDGGEWSQETKLTQPDAADGDEFGEAVAINGETIAVGAPGNDSSRGLAGDYGAVYVFAAEGEGYALEAILQPDDTFGDQEVGSDLALEGDTVVVGAPGTSESPDGFDDFSGTAYVWQRSDGSWSLEAELDRDSDGYTAFGTAVAFDGETALVGAPGVDRSFGVYPGGVFAYAASDWNETAEITHEDSDGGDRFGAAIAFHGDVFVGGAPHKDFGDASDHGAAYAFERTDGAWNQTANITSASLEGSDNYGSTLALSDRAAIVDASGNGSAFEVTRDGASWSDPAPFRPDDGEDGDDFGDGSALAGDLALVGAPGDSGDGTQQGAVHVIATGSTDGGDGGTDGGANGTDGEAGGNGAPGPGALAVVATGLAAASLAGRRRR